MIATKVIINTFRFGIDTFRKVLFVCEPLEGEYSSLLQRINNNFGSIRKPFSYYEEYPDTIIVGLSCSNSEISLEEISEVLTNDSLALMYSVSPSQDAKKALGLLRIEIDSTLSEIIYN